MKSSRQIYRKKKENIHNQSVLEKNACGFIRKKKKDGLQREEAEEEKEREVERDCTLPVITYKAGQTQIYQSVFERGLSYAEQGESRKKEGMRAMRVKCETEAGCMREKEELRCTGEGKTRNFPSTHMLPSEHNRTLESSVINLRIQNTAPKLKTNRVKSQYNSTVLKKPTAEHLPQTKHLLTKQVSLSTAKADFLACLDTIPKDLKNRNQTTLKQPLHFLEIFNPFFNRTPRIVSVCLLKIGRVVHKSRGEVLYKLGQQASSFYVVLSGKVKLVNGGLKRLCQTGETVLEEVLFLERDRKIGLEKCKVVGEACLLEIGLGQFKSMREEMTRHGFRLAMQQLEVVIKRNYIVKNWLRNKVRAESEN